MRLPLVPPSFPLSLSRVTASFFALTSLPDVQSCTPGNVSLNDGQSRSSVSQRFAGGRLEICVGGQWMSPDRSDFTMSAAHVVCVQLYGGSAYATAVVDGSNL